MGFSRRCFTGAVVSLGVLAQFCVPSFAQDTKKINEDGSEIVVLFDGQEFKVSYLSGGDPLGEGRKTEKGSIIYDKVTPLTLGLDTRGVGAQNIRHWIEKYQGSEKGWRVTVFQETKAGKLRSIFTGAGFDDIAPPTPAPGGLYEEVTLKPIRLELNS